ncbi:MAG TPA: acyl carrier protein [Candidatus Limnocylindrales bacterium]|nr:acyl carrier protein [Candidatus Limnocylindrales bacterium]
MAKVLALPKPLTHVSLVEWLRGFIAAQAGVTTDQVGPDVPFETFGLDSLSAVKASGVLEKALSLRLPPGLLYEYPTVSALAKYLAIELDCAEA